MALGQGLLGKLKGLFRILPLKEGEAVLSLLPCSFGPSLPPAPPRQGPEEALTCRDALAWRLRRDSSLALRPASSVANLPFSWSIWRATGILQVSLGSPCPSRDLGVTPGDTDKESE